MDEEVFSVLKVRVMYNWRPVTRSNLASWWR